MSPIFEDLDTDVFDSCEKGTRHEDLEHLDDLRQDNSLSALETEMLEEIFEKYQLRDEDYVQLSKILLQNMEKGLSKEHHAKAVVKMFPTYVRSLPNGSETGNFLALDLGGTNFRVLLVTLKGNEVEMKNKIFIVSKETMLGEGSILFDHIAECLKQFIVEHNLKGQKLPLGFTFSFPCKQEGLAVGKLVRWTKGFQCAGVEGRDVVQLLHEAVLRKGIDVDCVAILNDTVGCLMSCAFLDHDCEIGVILGTGTNACYMEKLERVGTWDGPHNEPHQVIINTEWGAFGDDGAIDFIRTDVDKAIDSESLNPNKQVYEKLISGMYMGEIARRVIVECASQKLLFHGKITTEMGSKDRFYTKYVSEIEMDTDDSDFSHCKSVCKELGYDNISAEDCKVLIKICQLISTRAAYLASAGIATLLNRISKENVTVAVDGSLYRFHPKFHTLMMQKIKDMINPGLKFRLMLSEDGSGKGAALVAAVAARTK